MISHLSPDHSDCRTIIGATGHSKISNRCCSFRKSTRFCCIRSEAQPTTHLQVSRDSVTLASDDFIAGNILQKEQEFFNRLPSQQWNGQKCTFSETLGSPDALIALGFYELEEWGVWSRTDNPKLVLPFLVEGEVVIEIETVGFGPNLGRDVKMAIGDASTNITLSPHPQKSSHLFRITQPSRIIEFKDLIPARLDERDDPRTMALGVSKISIAAPTLSDLGWDGEPIFIDLAEKDDTQLDFLGFHSREPWGIWSEGNSCHVILPFSIHGDCEIQFFAQGFGRNIGAPISLSFGDTSATFVLEQEPKQFIFRFTTKRDAQILCISGLTPDTFDDQPGARTMGIGIHRLQITLPPGGELVPAQSEKQKTFASVRAPKRWRRLRAETEDILPLDVAGFTCVAIFDESSNSNQWRDVVSAFLWTFRDQHDATLIIQNSNASLASFFSELMFLFFRVGEMKCHVIAIHTPFPHREALVLLRAADLYIHIDSSIDLEIVLSQTNRDKTRFIISSPENIHVGEENLVLIKPHRRPIKTAGYLHRVERELEYALDWVRLSEEMKHSYTRWKN